MRRPLFVLASLVVLASSLFACGGDDNSNSGSTSQPTAVATRVSTGPAATLNPKSGPPGIQVTATGTGWPAGVEVAITGGAAGSKPYTTAFTDRNGGFRASFFLEKKPDGSALETGRYDLIASAGTTNLTIPFLVEVRRPVTGPGPGGG